MMKKMIKRIGISLLMCGLLMTEPVIAYASQTDDIELSTEDVEAVSGWTDLKNAIQSGKSAKLMSNFNASASSGTIFIEDHDVVIDLNGHTFGIIQSNNVLLSVKNGSLTIKDSAGGGKITGLSGSNSGGGMINVNTGGTLNIESGEFSGFASKAVNVVNNATVNMSGGKITGNSGCGILLQSGTFNMTGGEITGNTCNNGCGGVKCSEGTTINVSGNAKIYGNYDSSTNPSKPADVGPLGGTYPVINVIGALDPEAQIGVVPADGGGQVINIDVPDDVDTSDISNAFDLSDGDSTDKFVINGDQVVVVPEGSQTVVHSVRMIDDQQNTDKTIYVVHGSYINIPNDNLVKTGYTNVKWYKQGAGSPFEFATTAITEDTILVTGGVAEEYDISYDLDGGSISGGTNPSKYTIATDDITLINPTKTGYSFAGWTGTDLKEASTSVKIAKGSMGKRSYKATWKEEAKPEEPQPANNSEPDSEPEDEYDASIKALRNYVPTLYNVFLGRDAEKGGYDYWCSLINEGKADGAVLARGFVLSEEFGNRNLSNGEYVSLLYWAILNRDPDEGGFAYWVGKLDSNEMSREEVLASFINSEEFTNNCNNSKMPRGTMEKDASAKSNEGVRRFVLRNYKYILKRKADAAGLEKFCYEINSGTMTFADVSSAFFTSDELSGKEISNDEFVRMLYYTYFERVPDSSGYSDWMGKLEAGEKRDVVISGFANSEEFAGILAKYK